jgi:hypothetical protein
MKITGCQKNWSQISPIRSFLRTAHIHTKVEKKHVSKTEQEGLMLKMWTAKRSLVVCLLFGFPKLISRKVKEYCVYPVTEQVGTYCNISDLYHGDVHLEPRKGHQIIWMRLFVIFFPSGKFLCVCLPNILPRPIPSTSFTIQCSLIIPLFDVT